MLSFSGQLVQTVALHRDIQALSYNYNATKNFLLDLGIANESPVIRQRNESKNIWDGYLWQNVPATNIVGFLNAYRSHPAAHRVNTFLLAEFIGGMNKAGELTDWTVTLIGASGGDEHILGPGLAIPMLRRKSLEYAEDRYSIGTLITPRDEGLDLDNTAWNAALQLTRKTWHADPGRSRRKEEPDEPSGPCIRQVRGFGDPEFGVAPQPKRGLLLLYMLNPEEAKLQAAPPVVALGLSFPGSKSGTKVKYKVNNIYWEQEYGPAS
jgi:hypothetical protein